MQGDLHSAWQKGKPWSPHARAGTEGRFAIRNLAQAYSLPPALVQHMLETWLTNEMVGMELVDKTTKTRGLKVLKWID